LNENIEIIKEDEWEDIDNDDEDDNIDDEDDNIDDNDNDERLDINLESNQKIHIDK